MNLAVFFHTRLSGGCNVDTRASIDPAFGRELYLEQIVSLIKSGLWDAAEKIIIGINGDTSGVFFHGKPELLRHGNDAESLLPTMRALQQWLPGHEDYAVCFFHAKGVTHPHDPMNDAWRACMTKHVITDWRKCVADLEAGYDTVGCHWLHNIPNDPNASRWGSNSFFGGVFWWATAKYLITLPPFPTDKPRDRHEWYYPELWLGCGKPRIKDYHPGCPNLAGCQQSALSP